MAVIVSNPNMEANVADIASLSPADGDLLRYDTDGTRYSGVQPDALVVTVNSEAETLQDWLKKVYGHANLAEYGAIVGDGTTTNNTAITAANSAAIPIFVPPGVYRTTATASGAALTGMFRGPGQIETNDGNALPPNWRVVSSLPTEGNHDYILTAGNGDAQKVQDFLGTWVTGSSTLTQPATGYKIVYEAAGRLNHFLLTASAGWNESTTGNGGRTGYFHTITRGTQAGNGDAGGYYTSIFVPASEVVPSRGVGMPDYRLADSGKAAPSS